MVERQRTGQTPQKNSDHDRNPERQDNQSGHGGEYEPRDSRNVTGTASTPDGRWTSKQRKPPAAMD